MEEWKEIKGFEGLYEISNFGLIRSMDLILTKNLNGTIYDSKRFGKVLSPASNGLGYLQIGLSKNQVRQKFYMHRLVYLTFVGEIPDGYEVNHIDHDKSNNKLSNLELVTKSENNQKWRVFYNKENTVKRKKVNKGKILLNNKKFNCSECNEPINKNKGNLCLECHNKNKSNHIPPKEEILELLKTNSYVGVAKIYGVSDKTIKKWSQRT